MLEHWSMEVCEHGSMRGVGVWRDRTVGHGSMEVWGHGSIGGVGAWGHGPWGEGPCMRGGACMRGGGLGLGGGLHEGGHHSRHVEGRSWGGMVGG